MSSILRALRRLEADARHDEADNATLHEHVVFAAKGRRNGKRTVFAMGALVVVAVCGIGLAIAVLRLAGTGQPDRAAPTTLRVTPRAPKAPSQVATPAAAIGAGLVAAESRPRSGITIAEVPTHRTPVATVQSPPPLAAAAAPALASPSADPSKAPASQGAAAPSRGGAPVGVERILWHPSAAKRRAWLRVDGEEETREVQEGETIGRFAVTRIDAGSVLFRSGSTELLYKLGASER